MESKDNNQDIKINSLEKAMEYLTKGFDKLDKKLDEFIKTADGKYASKRTEKNVDRLGWIVIGSVVLGGLALIIK
jgi:hypothetical protein